LTVEWLERVCRHLVRAWSDLEGKYRIARIETEKLVFASKKRTADQLYKLTLDCQKFWSLGAGSILPFSAS
jgi:hypothetical protein